MSNNQEQDEMSNMQKTLMETLDWAYDKAINGLPGFGTAEDLAKDYLTLKNPLDKQIDSLIRWQNTKCATTGFLAGLGGAITIPISIPADLASVLYVQIRMIAAIAYMCGYDIRDDRVKTLVYVCLVGNSAQEVLKEFGIQFANKFAQQFIMKKISGAMLMRINKQVGFRLLTKAGSTGMVNLIKLVPIAGGLVGAGLNIFTTSVVGKAAKTIFYDKPQLMPEKVV